MIVKMRNIIEKEADKPARTSDIR